MTRDRSATLAGVATLLVVPVLVLAAALAGATTGAATSTATAPSPSPSGGAPAALDRPVDGVERIDRPRVTVANVTVAPARPVAGEPFTVETTIENRGRTAYWVEAVALRAPPESRPEEYARVQDAGALSAGSRLAVPLTQQFGEPGSYRLRVVVYLDRDDSPPRRIQYPIVVDVVDPSERGPTVDVDVGPAVVGAGTTVDVTVANDLPSNVVGGTLALSGAGLDVADPRRAFARLDRGTSLNESFDVVPTRTGRLSANLTVTYTRADGERRRFVEPVTFDVAAGTVRLDARVEPSAAADGRVVVANVTNGRAAPVSDVRLRGRSANASLAGSLPGPVPPGESRSIALPLDPAAAGTVPLTATYRVDGRVGRASDRVRVPDAPAEIALTGVVVRRDGDRVHVSGSASNVGLQTANGVLVGVVDTAAVTPAPPQRDYFVGQVGVSNFVAFDVYAAVDDGEVDAVPVRVSYLSGGRRRSTVVEVPLDGLGTRPAAGAGAAVAADPHAAGSSGSGSSGSGSSDGGLPVALPAVGAVAVALVVVGFLAVRRRAGDGS